MVPRITVGLLGACIACIAAGSAIAQCAPTPPLNVGAIQSYSFTADDQHLIVALKDKASAGLWSPDSGQRVLEFPGALAAYRMRGEPQFLVWRDAGRELWSSNPPAKVRELPPFPYTRYGSQRYAFQFVEADGRWRIVTHPEGEQRASLKGAKTQMPVISDKGNWAVAYFPPSSMLVRSGQRRDLSGSSADAVLWDLAGKKQVAQITHRPAIERVVASPDGRTLATGGPYMSADEKDDRTVKLWDAASGRELASYRGFQEPLFTADGRFLTMATSSDKLGADGNLAVAPVDRPGEVMRSAAHHPAHDSGLLSDGRFLARQQAKGLSLESPGLDVIDPGSMRPTLTLPGDYRYFALSEDGRFLVARRDAGEDRTIEVYALPAFQKVCSFAWPKDWDPSVEISATGRYIVLSKWDSKGIRVELYERQDPSVQAGRLAAMRKQSEALTTEQRIQVQSLFRQAFELFQAGEFDAALIGFQKGLQVDPANGLGNFYIAETYARLKRTDQARIHYQRTVEFAPDSKEALLAQARIAK